MKFLRILLMLVVMAPTAINAQDYTKQFEAFKQAIETKNEIILTPYLSSELGFPPMIPKGRVSPGLLKQIFAGISEEITSVSLKTSKPGEIIIIYDFIDSEKANRDSSILFDSEGKITRIKIVEELIKEGQERRLGKDAEQPIADEFTKKYPAKKVEFKTEDDRSVIGDLYDIGGNKPVILLCHQLRNNKYDYADIAPKLNNMGFNALAIDLTGGGTFAAHNNETVDKGVPLGTTPADRQVMINRAQGEIDAAINYLNKKYNRKVIIWGSSYSASLVIAVASKNENVDAVMSFSGLGGNLSAMLAKINKPVFMTSSKAEVPRVKAIINDVPSKKHLTHFIPKSDGDHGSNVLWNGQPYAEEYWVAIKSFLNEIKN